MTIFEEGGSGIVLLVKYSACLGTFIVKINVFFGKKASEELKE